MNQLFNKDPDETASELAERMRAKLESLRKLPPLPDEARPAPELNGPCRPDCPICHGLGFIRLDLPRYDPNFGKIKPCPNISIWELVGNASGLNSSEVNLNWGNLLLTTNDIKKARVEGEALINRGYGWLTLWGEYGTAKTHILKIMTALILQARQQAVYVRMTDLLDDLRSAFDEKNPSEAAVRRLSWYSEVYCLAIDEFDRINPTPWATERRFSLMDKRYELAIRRKGITLLALNCNPQTIEGYLSDRIFDGRFKVIRFANSSLRPGLDWADHQKLYEQAYEPGEHKDED